MNLSNFRILARAYIPGAKAQVINDTVIDLILNNATVDIASYTCCLKANKKFNIVAEQQEYLLSTVIGDYLTPDKSGLWWNRGTVASPDWEQLNARTLAWLDQNRPDWRSLDSGDPQDYAIDGDTITLVPKPDTSLSSGLWLYYGKKPVSMTAVEHYPFTGSPTELTHLTIFDEAILSFAQWAINPMLNEDKTIVLNRQIYLQIREEKYNLFKQRKDISNSVETRLRGPSFRG